MRSSGVILLAAGASTRLGSPKQLVQYEGLSLLRRAALTALQSRCRPVIVVLGADCARLRPELDGLAVQIVENAAWPSGMASSLQAGLTALPDDVDGALVMLCDQPLLTPEILDALADTGQSAEAPLAACDYGGTLGVPARFGRTLWPELFELRGQQGAKSVIERHAAEAVRVPFSGGEWDIDTPDDLARLRSR